MRRDELRDSVEQLLGNRSLVWFGLRGAEAEALSDLPQFGAAFSNIGRYSPRADVCSLAYEDLSGFRPDMETWDLDEQRSDPCAQEFRQEVISAVFRSSAVVPYRPSDFLSSIVFSRQGHCLHLGPFASLQRAFEYKPWVETELRARGVSTLPWTYVADEEFCQASRMLLSGSIVLRRSRGSGGEGIERVESRERLDKVWKPGSEGFLSVAPYLERHLSLNISGVVWCDGVTLHAPSQQIIGVPWLTRREFGYCGNDFGSVRGIDAEVWDQVERQARLVGNWLGGYRYRGAFGVDLMVSPNGEVLFTELNARFQGSTRPSSQLSWYAGEPDVVLEHVAACLGLRCWVQDPLRERVGGWPMLTHIVGHQADQDPDTVLRKLHRLLPHSSVDLVAEPGVDVAPDGVLFQLSSAHPFLNDMGDVVGRGAHVENERLTRG